MGNIIYQKYIYSQEYQEFYSIQPAGNGDLLFVGESYLNVNQSMRDIYVIRTDSMLNFPPNLIGIKRIDEILPSNFKLYQNYPNPFNPKTIIKFDNKKNSNITLKIYDITGREVYTLIDDRIKPGEYEIEFDAGNLSSGVYFYTLTAENFIETKLMSLIK